MPKISVLMGIYNCASTLEEAIISLQEQTFEDWECILCDDGSTDNTYSVAEHLCQRDSRLHLIRNEKNQGLAFTLNHCLAEASGEYIARMDGDDHCPPNRFILQCTFLDTHPEYSIVSGWMECFDADGVYGLVKYREIPQLQDFIYGSQFCHAASMIRRQSLVDVHGYRVSKNSLRVEDYDLWVRMYEHNFYGYNLQTVLYEMRDDRNAIKRRKIKYRLNECRIRWHIINLLGFPLALLPQVIMPVAIGLLPFSVYQYFHRLKVKM